MGGRSLSCDASFFQDARLRPTSKELAELSDFYVCVGPRFDAHGSPASCLQILDRSRRSVQSSECLGFVGWEYSQLHGSGVAELVLLAVRQGYRRQGIGARLLSFAVETAEKAATASCMFLHVQPDNVAARTLYAKFGFREVEVVSGFTLVSQGSSWTVHYLRVLCVARWIIVHRIRHALLQTARRSRSVAHLIQHQVDSHCQAGMFLTVSGMRVTVSVMSGRVLVFLFGRAVVELGHCCRAQLPRLPPWSASAGGVFWGYQRCRQHGGR